jgi:ABC-type lipoprotein release transport system permease subunit
VTGVFRTFSKEFDARFIRITLPAAQELLNRSGVNTIVVSLKNTGDEQGRRRPQETVRRAAVRRQDLGRAERLLREDRSSI